LLAREVLTTYGGDPINCDGQALQCAIGNEEFIDFNGEKVKADEL